MELVVQSGPDSGKVIPVGRQPVVAGRQEGTDLTLKDAQASRRHAAFELVDGNLLVSDLGSFNGTLVNGQALAPNQPRRLAPGDFVQIGSTLLVVRPTNGAGASLPPNPGYNQPPYPQNYPNPAAPARPPYPPQPGPPPAGYQGPVGPPPYPGYQGQVGPPPYPGYQGPPPGGLPYPAQSPIVRPASQVKVKNSSRPLLIGGLVVIGALVALTLGIFALLGGSRPETNSSPGLFNPSAVPGNSQLTPPAASPTPLVGPSGTNPPPPPPPVSAIKPWNKYGGSAKNDASLNRSASLAADG